MPSVIHTIDEPFCRMLIGLAAASISERSKLILVECNSLAGAPRGGVFVSSTSLPRDQMKSEPRFARSSGPKFDRFLVHWLKPDKRHALPLTRSANCVQC